MARLLIYLTLLLLVCGSAIARDPMYCSKVLQDFLPCINYVGGMSTEPTSNCCNGLGKLNGKAKHKNGPKKICHCIEDMAYVMNIPFIASHIQALPAKCHEHFSFPLSNSMDCSRVY